MTDKKKKPEAASKKATTARYNDVAKELGLEVKALLALVDQFVDAHPDFKDYVYNEGKNPAASNNFPKFIRDDFMKFAGDKLPKKAPEPEPEPAAEQPKAPEPAKPVPPVAPAPVVPAPKPAPAAP
ncbi:MAG: hypothetical protein ACKOY8_09560, partial [Verrucomicrobiota bacterium]